MSSILCSLLSSISNSYGNKFFKNTALSINKLINSDVCIIASIDNKNITATTIVNAQKESLENNYTYTLANTPCDESIRELTYYDNNISTNFPKDKRLSDPLMSAYLGMPIYNPKDNCIGLLLVMYQQPIDNKEQVIELFNAISGRISAELSHRNDLKLLKNQLQKSEKMASLGSLVAGVTHEVNTPLGIAITTHSILAGECQTLALHVKNQDLTMSAMNSYIEATENALVMQGENLDRAKKLIENFKETATDQHQLEVDNINIKDYYQKVVSTLRSLLKPQKVNLTIKCDHDVNVKTYPGIHAQIITNLISNSVRHGFSDQHSSIAINNTIIITITQKSVHEIEVDYQDNGAGLSNEAAQHVFEPFYTTARDKGGIGLGMSIISKLINEKLHGEISVDSQAQGARFIYTFQNEQDITPMTRK